MTKRFSDVLTDAWKRIEKRQWIYGTLGRIDSTGAYTIAVPGRSNFVYVTLRHSGGAQTVVEARNDAGVRHSPKLGVKMRLELGHYVIYGRAGVAQSGTDNTETPPSGVEPHTHAHSELTDIDLNDDHPQYLNVTRANVLYYGKGEFIDVSAGVADADKPIKTGADGLLDGSFLDPADLPEEYPGDEFIQDLVSTMFTGNTGILDATYNDTTGVITLTLDVSAANKYLYSTAADTWAEGDITAFARGLLDDADAATMRTTLGLVIGTNVQAFDSELAALAGLTSAADRLPYFTGSGAAALATFTAFGRSLVDDADAAAGRATLALGTMALEAAANYGPLAAANIWTAVQTFPTGTKVGANTGGAFFAINGGAGDGRQLYYYTAGVLRWLAEANSTAESGSNAGSDYAIRSFTDAGAALRTDLIITRSSGLWTLGGPLTVGGTIPIVTLSSPSQGIILGTELGGISWSADDTSAGVLRTEGAYIKYVATGTWDGTNTPAKLSIGIRASVASFLDDAIIIENGGHVTFAGNLKSPVILTPTIADFTNANHDHDDAAGGGVLTAYGRLAIGNIWTATQFLDGGAGLFFRHPSVDHGMISVLDTDVYAAVAINSGTAGGIQLIGASDTDALGFRFLGFIGTSTPTLPAIRFEAYKKNGSTIQPFGASESAIDFLSGGSTTLMRLYGGGDARIAGKLGVGSLSAPGANVLGIRAGTSSNDAAVGGDLWQDITQRGNSTSVLTNLGNFSLIANSLSVNGSYLKIEAWGSFANNANAKTLNFVFGTDIFSLPSLSGALASWYATIIIIRTGATTQKVRIIAGLSGFSPIITISTASATLSNPNDVKFTAQGVATNDILQQAMIVEWHDANS